MSLQEIKNDLSLNIFVLHNLLMYLIIRATTPPACRPPPPPPPTGPVVPPPPTHMCPWRESMHPSRCRPSSGGTPPPPAAAVAPSQSRGPVAPVDARPAAPARQAAPAHARPLALPTHGGGMRGGWDAEGGRAAGTRFDARPADCAQVGAGVRCPSCASERGTEYRIPQTDLMDGHEITEATDGVLIQ